MSLSPFIAIGSIYAIVYIITLGYGSYLISDANSKIEQIGLFRILILNGNGRQRQQKLTEAEIEQKLIDIAVSDDFYWKGEPKLVYIRAVIQRNAGITLLIKSLVEIGAAILLFSLVKQGRRQVFNIWLLVRLVLSIALVSWFIYLFILVMGPNAMKATIGMALVVILILFDCPLTCCFAFFVGWSMKNQETATADRQILGPGYGLQDQGSMQGLQSNRGAPYPQQQPMATYHPGPSVARAPQYSQQKPMGTLAPAPQNPQQPAVTAPAAPKVHKIQLKYQKSKSCPRTTHTVYVDVGIRMRVSLAMSQF